MIVLESSEWAIPSGIGSMFSVALSAGGIVAFDRPSFSLRFNCLTWFNLFICSGEWLYDLHDRFLGVDLLLSSEWINVWTTSVGRTSQLWAPVSTKLPESKQNGSRRLWETMQIDGILTPEIHILRVVDEIWRIPKLYPTTCKLTFNNDIFVISYRFTF